MQDSCREERRSRVTYRWVKARDFRPKASYAKPGTWFTYLVSVPGLTWIILWLGINTGPWALRHQPGDLIEWLHYFRTLFPVFFFIVGFGIGINRDTGERVITGPMTLWVAYAIIGLISGWVVAPGDLDTIYWIIVYLAAFVSLNLFLQGAETLHKAIHLNYLNWIITAVFLAVMVFVARDVLLVDTRWGPSGYGISARMDSFAGMGMSRSSGMARFAAVPAVAAFVFLWKASGPKRLLWAIPLTLSGTLVYLMQSRGAILGLGFALGFVVVFLGTRTRIMGVVFLLVFGAMLYTEMISEQRINLEKDRFYRGAESEEQLFQMTGRIRAWRNAWDNIKQSPILGYGPQSDRRLLNTHVHNTYLYALLQSGFLGAAAFVGGLVWAWVLFFRAILRRTADLLGQRFFLIQVGGILAFFTVRSIPEVCGAMFGVDLMVMLPILAYLGVLDRHGALLAKHTTRPIRPFLPNNIAARTERLLPPIRPLCPSRPSKSPRW